MFADVYVHRDDLGHTMTTVRVLIPITNALVDIFVLQVSINTGRHRCSITNVKEDPPKYIRKAVT
jgi:hypothetical protein